jgi:hypothetical protein
VIFEIRDQRIDVDIFFLAMVVKATVLFGMTLGLPYIEPVSSLIAGAGKTGSIHEGFQEIQRISIKREPISGKGLCGYGQQV